jgi:hypothetical protein
METLATSTNPRLRRAYAHAMLTKYKHGEAAFEDTAAAVERAAQTSRGQLSGYAGWLASNPAIDTAPVVVWPGADSKPTPEQIQRAAELSYTANFGQVSAQPNGRMLAVVRF